MVFANLVFLYVFLPLNIILYFCTKNRAFRNAVLIIFSLCILRMGRAYLGNAAYFQRNHRLFSRAYH